MGEVLGDDPLIRFVAGVLVGIGATLAYAMWITATPETETTGAGSVTYQSFLGSGPAT